MLLKCLFEFLGVDVALERYLELSILGIINGAVQRNGLSALDMTFGGVEMRVSGNDSARCHKVAEEHILGSTSLMGRYDVAETSEPFNGIFQLKERR